jgi:ABC-type bacteriocin/lantibiotic exporter with double-glycine peptidase domain
LDIYRNRDCCHLRSDRLKLRFWVSSPVLVPLVPYPVGIFCIVAISLEPVVTHDSNRAISSTLARRSPDERNGVDDVAVIELHGLTKRFGDVIAVDDLSFEVDSGQVVGFLGPNGAGKTTTLRMLLDLATPPET